MRIRYLKGNQAGMVEELPDRDAEAAIADGFCEAVVPPAVPPAVKAEPKPAPKATKAPKRRGTRARRK